MLLETERLLYREWRDGDVDDLVEALDNLNVTKWLAYMPHPYTKKDAQKWVKFCAENSKKGAMRSSYEFAIVLKSENKAIGGFSVNQIDRKQGTAGGGIWLNEKYARMGYGSEAWGERIRFAFEDLGLRRLENGFFKGNEASFRMQKKFGYKLEGVRRKGKLCMADGKLKDECMTGLLKNEWKKPKKKKPR